MFAHVLLLLCSCACALSEGPSHAKSRRPPHYKEANRQYKQLAADLQELIVSMRGNIPLLTDPRRHHAVIFNVLDVEAQIQSGCMHADYEISYINNLNTSVPEAICNPEKVIKSTQTLLDTVDKYTEGISQLIDDCLESDDVCDARIHDIIKEKRETDYAAVLLLAGKAACKLNEKDALMNFYSNKLNSLHFILNAKDELKVPVLALADLYRFIAFKERSGALTC